MAKRYKNQSGLDDMGESVDRISSLCLPLLHHVLSFVARTCVLSKNWRNIWCSVPTLNFDAKPGEENAVINFVDSVLILREDSNISKFQFFTWKVINDKSKFNLWIQYAIKQNVQVVDIRGAFRFRYELTPNIFKCQSLKECRLSGYTIKQPASICLPALKLLHLIGVKISGSQLGEAFFSAIPSLESFTLVNCLGASSPLTISACQVKNLKVEGTFPESVLLSALNLILLELKLSSFFATIKCNLSLEYLSDTILHVTMNSWESTAQMIGTMKNV